LRQNTWQEIHFSPPKNLTNTIQDFSFAQNLRLDPHCPSAGGRYCFEDLECRWFAVIPPASGSSSYIAFRKHRFDSLRATDFLCGEEQRSTLSCIFQSGYPCIIAGQTGVGKTSLLYSLLKEYYASKRVVILEDLDEIPASGIYWSKLFTVAPSIEGKGLLDFSDLIKLTLRMRPDVIVMGESRTNDLTSFAQLRSLGHSRIYTTMHASSVEDIHAQLPGASDHFAIVLLEGRKVPHISFVSQPALIV
jgi:Flp pilus assembly CpaF family ATPase